MLHSQTCLTVFFINAVSHSYLFMTSSAIPNVTTVAGFRVQMNCSITVQHTAESVIWLNPQGTRVSIGYTVVESLSLLKVFGNPATGEYNLLIKYARYPQDVGVWSCVSLADSTVTHQTQLIILVPPPNEDPEATPAVIAAESEIVQPSNSHKGVYIFTCVGHYAYPPVELKWFKERGPDVPYSVQPPRIIASRVNTISVSITLTVTQENARSIFTCNASHLTFGKRFGSRSVRFMLDEDEASSLPRAHAVITSQNDRSSEVQSTVQVKQLDGPDRVFILLTVAIVAVCLILGTCLNKFRSKWSVHVCNPRNPTQRKTDRSPDENALGVVEEAGQMLPSSSSSFNLSKFSCGPKCTVCTFTTFTVLLVSSLLYAFPFYMKGISVPIVDTNEIVSIFAGGALWLDCSALVEPVESLVQVSWYRRDELLFYQYWVDGRNIGFPPSNSTSALMFAARTTSAMVGQINVWPVIPHEDGVYRCDVIMAEDSNEGRHVVQSKTFSVFVLMGPVTNYALLVCVAVALFSAVFIISLVVFHSFTCRCRQLSKSQLNQ